MIITNIVGGLGNQMFQYSIAKSIAKKRKDTFKLDISFYPNQTLRKYELNFFNIEEVFATPFEIEQFKGKRTFLSKFKKKLGFEKLKNKGYFNEKALSVYDQDVFEYDENIYLDGYWQSEKYFLDIKDEICKDFSLKNPISVEANKYLKEIHTKESVSIHIRRGDYVHNSHTNSVHGVCSLDYYKNAIDYMDKNIDSAYYFIFSDDIQWCKDNFSFLANKCFIDDTKSTFDDLDLMKNCRHNIIANSTFSWWAAWLNSNNDKIVICPKNWFSNTKMQKESKDIMPQNWLKI